MAGKGSSPGPEGRAHKYPDAWRDKAKKDFITGFLEYGTVRSGCRVAKISRTAFYEWVANDPEFAERVADARQEFGEKLEEVIVGIVMDPEQARKTPVLAITLLNANLPHKYRPAAIMQEETARDLLKEWRKAAQAPPQAAPPEEADVPVEQQIEEILSKRAENGEAEVN